MRETAAEFAGTRPRLLDASPQTRPLRILHIVYGLGRGGLQTGLENLLGGLDRHRFEHVICALRPPIDHPMCHGLAEFAELMCIRTTESSSRYQLGPLISAIRRVKPDIVHSRNWACVEGVLAARWVGSCAVVHGEHGIDTNLVDSEPRRRSLYRRVAFEMADRVLSVSGQLRDLYSKRTGFPAERITVVHNGVNTRRFFPEPAARVRVRHDLGLAGDELCIGSVGHLSTVKDHLTELRALAEVAGALPNWRFLIFGEGAERARLDAFLESHPEWKHRVRFAGLSREMPDMLRAMDIFVLSSITEGMCNSLLEAMATGLPVIATRTGGNPEAVVDGDSGLLFPVGNHQQLAQKLLLLSGRPELRRSLGQSAIRRIHEQFSVESMVRGYDRVYGSLAMRKAAA